MVHEHWVQCILYTTDGLITECYKDTRKLRILSAKRALLYVGVIFELHVSARALTPKSRENLFDFPVST